MTGFGVELDQLRSAAGYVGDAAELADQAATGVGDSQVDAPWPAPDPFGWTDRYGTGEASHVFGDSVGFDSIAWAYSKHVEAMRQHLRDLQESARSGSDALNAVAEIYQRADDANRM
ncbi:hypothetical protein [Saccharomonospora saliphila]|uniref:hypothetical protein n=1 Tax=Saccharomonospora saliphila TaxID=369829 RepID=UPI0003821F27|nr:hypothetical protein [Saccharomonospora saliphila]